MKFVVAIMAAVAIALLGGMALGAPDELVRTDIKQPILAGSDLLANGMLSFDGNPGIHYLFATNGTMTVTDEMFGGSNPVPVLAKSIFRAFPEVQTIVFQADKLTFER